MATRGLTSAERVERERRRQVAAELFASGEYSQAAIARMVGVSPQAVNVWHWVWKSGGVEALGSIGPPGRHAYLNVEQTLQLRDVLRAGAKLYGFVTDGWTLARVRRVIGERFAVTFSTLGGVAVLLRRMGFSAQRPQRLAVERDEEAVATWMEQRWPEIEKRGPKAGRGSALPMRPVVH